MRQKLLSFYHKYSEASFCWLSCCYGKTYISYHIDFDLGVRGWFQASDSINQSRCQYGLLLSLSLFSKNVKRGHRILFAIYLFHSMLLYANIVYYQEFTDFLTLSAMMEQKHFVGSENLFRAISLVKWYDFLYWLICLSVYPDEKKALPGFGRRKTVIRKTVGGKALAWLSSSLVNLGFGWKSASILLTQTFDRNDIVKHLGINAFTVYDSIRQ